MSELADILREGVALVQAETESLQASIVLERWLGQNEFGSPTYDTPMELTAVVEKKTKDLKGGSASQQETLATTYVGIFVPLEEVDLSLMTDEQYVRQGPVDPNDRITLPDGTTGPILNIGGFVDKDTSQPLYHEVWLGWSRSRV